MASVATIRVEEARAGAEAAPVAELRGVSKRYGATTALDGVDLAFRPGELTAVLGPNGAGKTSAVKLLLGLGRPSSGTVRVFGREPDDLASRRRVGAMLQVSRVPETLKVREHLELFSSYYPDPLPAREVVAAAGLDGLENKLFGRLSGGERQRVLFALALCGNPDLLFLDEPTVNLDVESRRSFWGHIRRLIAAGRSVVLTTHYIEEADALADRVVVLHQGRVIADGAPAQIKQKASGKRVRCSTVLDPETLRTFPGVRSVERDRALVEIVTTDADALVRELLTRDPRVSGLEVYGVDLEDAFLALTGTPAPGTAGLAKGGSR